MTSETTAKKDLQKLQRAIVDGLEDVKGQDIVVFNTEHLSPLFERVIVASGTSNRQTKALAASVRDAVREAGFDKPRIEGEDNGEWIIVDCGQAVAHVMQPVIRSYYRLEEIWGEKPVRLKHGAAKPAAPAGKSTAAAAAGKPVASSGRRKTAAAEVPAPAKPKARKTAAPAAAKSSAKVPAKSVAAPKARKASAAEGSTKATKAPLKTVVVKPRSATKPAAKSGAKPASSARATSRVPAKKKA
jgi:ribosome-associated protein